MDQYEGQLKGYYYNDNEAVTMTGGQVDSVTDEAEWK